MLHYLNILLKFERSNAVSRPVTRIIKIKVFISTSSFGKFDPKPLDLLKDLGLDVILNPTGRTLKEDEIIAMISGCTGLIAGTEKLQRDALVQLDKLRIISRVGVGLDGIDLVAAKDLGIIVTNTPEAPCLAVTELTLGLILNLLRSINTSDKEIRAGLWSKHTGQLLSNKTVGIIGVGRIGKKLTAFLKSFNCRVIAFDIDPDPAWSSKENVALVDMEYLLKESDIVSIHTPLTAETHHLIGENELSLMKPGAYLVNVSRGGLVDETALYNRLKTNKLRGAAIDTFEIEPYNGPLVDLPNVIITAHIGSSAVECRVDMELQAANNLIENLKNIQK